MARAEFLRAELSNFVVEVHDAVAGVINDAGVMHVSLLLVQA